MTNGNWWALENPSSYTINSITYDQTPYLPGYGSFSPGGLDFPCRLPEYLTLIELTNGRTTTTLTAYTDPDSNESVVLAYGDGQLKELSVYLEAKPDAFQWRKIP